MPALTRARRKETEIAHAAGVPITTVLTPTGMPRRITARGLATAICIVAISVWHSSTATMPRIQVRIVDAVIAIVTRTGIEFGTGTTIVSGDGIGIATANTAGLLNSVRRP